LTVDDGSFFDDFAHIAMTLLFTSVYIPFFYMEDFASYQQLGPRLVLYSLSIMSAASFFGRILTNWIADW
jgi:hypothetical protein